MDGPDHERERERERELVERLAAGDASALAALYDRHAGVAFAVVLRIVGDRPGAEEVLQEVFLRVWRRGATYDRAVGGVRPWLLGIAHNLALNELRRRRRRPPEAVPPANPDAAPWLETLPDPDPGPAEQVWARARRERLRDALDRLPPPQRAVVALYADGYSQSEIAGRLALPLGTVKSRMRRGLQELREIVREEGFDLE